jgi:hypothetical protein
MPQRLTLFSGEQATEASSVPLSGGNGGTMNPLHGAWGMHPQLNWRLPRKLRRLETPQRRVNQALTIPRVPRIPRLKSSKQMEGEMKFLW